MVLGRIVMLGMSLGWGAYMSIWLIFKWYGPSLFHRHTSTSTSSTGFVVLMMIDDRKNGLQSAQSRGPQDIVFNLQIINSLPTRVSLGYTPPSDDNYETVWTESSDFSPTTTENIALASDTLSGGNN